MSKKKATIPSIPAIYQSLTRDASRQHCTIVEDTHGQYFRFNRVEENHILKDAIQKVWTKFDTFADEPKQTLLTYHANLFKSEPPKDQDLTTTALYIWFKMCDIATDRTVKTPKTTEGRVSSLGSRRYVLTDKEMNVAEIKTPQAITSYRILSDAIAAKTALDTKDMPDDVKKEYKPHVTEEELKKLVINRAGELKTKQDPWRIFQYYRPTLIKLGLIRTEG